MSTPQQPAASVAVILSALEATKDEVAAAKNEIVRLRRYGRRNRLLVLVDVLLTAGLAASGAVSVHAVQSAGQATQFAEQLHANNLAACQAFNVKLGKQQRALDAILQQVPPQTAAERAIVTRDLGFITAGWAPRQCAEAYPPPPDR